ncbi:MAG: NAD-dependent epimerase/dehydratase family protein [Planctomycetes bacterium]|nr:NAD-dependent epimerase/dehydratase family protein [Planctomycetota bacterium]
MKPRVFVTGATGFVGAELVRQLVGAGHEVDVLARASSDRSLLAGLPVRWREGELDSAPAVDDALAQLVARGGESWVVHSAAVISYATRDALLQRRVNVEGTRNVLAACRRHRVTRVLHVSSVVAVGHARPRELLDEDAAYNGAQLRCAYADTKRAAEELALEAARELDLVVVNPGAIFGTSPRAPNTIKFLHQLAHGPWIPFTPPGSLSVVGVRDVARGCVLALERGARGRRYLLCESAWSSLESFQLAARLLGVRAPTRSASAALWKSIELGARIVDLVAPPKLLTPTAVRMLGAHFRFDARRARAELGWQPEPFEDVLRETIAALRSRGEL